MAFIISRGVELKEKNPRGGFYCSGAAEELEERYSQVLFAGSTTDFALFVEEVEHAPQDGQQQDADDDDGDDDAFALWRRRSTRTRPSFNSATPAQTRRGTGAGASVCGRQAGVSQR